MPPRPDLVDRTSYLLDLCRGQRVLHLGCTNAPYTDQSLADGTLLHSKIAEVASEVWGVDNDRRGLETLAKRGFEHLVEADLEQLQSARLKSPFDLVVAGEILEHLSNPGLFLAAVRSVLEPHTRLVLTTVNAYCGLRFFRYALRGRGGLAEPVHPDHVAYYSYSTLRVLLERHNLEVTRFSFYDLGREHRPHNRFYLNWLNDLCVLMSRQLADGVIVECGLG